MQKRLTSFFLITVDIIVIIVSMITAIFVRFEGVIPNDYLTTAILVLPIVIAVKIACFYLFNLYSRLWRYASIDELMAIVLAGILGSVLFYAGCVFLGQKYLLPRSIHIFSGLLTIIGVGLSRFSIRLYLHYRNKQEKYTKANVLIVGAGDAGAVIAKEINQNKKVKQHIIGFIDDDKNKQGMSMLGSKILGGRSQIAEIALKYEVDEIIIAMPSVSGTMIKEIVDLCKDTVRSVKIAPSIYELIDDTFTLEQLRAIDVEDLLRREPVKLDEKEVAPYLYDKIVLITGAGGSIGSEISRQVAKLRPKQIVLLGKGENSIYEIEYELRKTFPKVEFSPVIADIKDAARIAGVFECYQPQVVFHAAAHKHVPLMELQPIEAIRNNVKGTKIVAETAKNYGVERFIMVSTDKAVNPTSVMGASKRVAEMIISRLGRTGETVFSTVRFGNVLGSRGSVIPLFKKQIAAGGPITITHPEITRYFMTIPEASQLVLQAGALAKGGEIFVLDMGEPVKIMDLAVELIKLSGLRLDEDIEIKITGLRTGEKLYEELLTDAEKNTSTKHSKIFIAEMSEVTEQAFSLHHLEELFSKEDSDEIVKILCEIVLSYTPNRS